MYGSINTKRVEVEITTICDKNQSERHVNEYFDKIVSFLMTRAQTKMNVSAFRFIEFKLQNDIKLWIDRYIIEEKMLVE